MKYRLGRNIEGKGGAGDIVELNEKEFNEFPFNVSLELLIPEEKEDDKKKIEFFEVQKEMKKLRNELVNEVGLSDVRASKVLAKFPNKKLLLENLNKLPFEKIENEAILRFYGEPKKRIIKKQNKEDKE